MKLLTADLHLDDNKENEYRWLVFERIIDFIVQYKVDELYILGDITDRKDRHSAYFINRLVKELKRIQIPTIIIAGNHDTTIHPPSFLEFLNEIENISYYTKPTIHNDVLLLPFSGNPLEDWKSIELEDFDAIFLHATVTGAKTENGFTLTNNKLPSFENVKKLYSGDIHTPQKVGNLIYVGAPHPVKFGDDYICRMLLLDDNNDLSCELSINVLSKKSVEISSVEELKEVKTKYGDKVKIKFNLDQHNLEDRVKFSDEIEAWAKQSNIELVGLEFSLSKVLSNKELDISLEPESILAEYAQINDINEELLNIGLEFLK